MAKDWKGLIGDVAGDVRRLDYVNRYSSIPVVHQESVASHSYWVTVYSLLIHREMFPGMGDMERAIVVHALTHDMGECVTGDLVRTFKYSDPALKKAADAAEERLAARLPNRIQSLFKTVEEAKAGPDFAYIKDVTKAADFLSLTLYMNRELVRGNQEILPFFERMEQDLQIASNDLVTRSGKGGGPYLEELSRVYDAMHATARDLHRMRIV